MTTALALWTVFGAIFIIQRFTGIVKGTAIANAFMFIPTIPCLLGFIWRRYHRTAAIRTMVVAAVPSISIICYKGIYKGQPVFFEVFIVTAAVTLLSGIVFGCVGRAGPEEVRLRENFYRRVGDPYFRSGQAPIFGQAVPSILPQGLAGGPEVMKGS